MAGLLAHPYPSGISLGKLTRLLTANCCNGVMRELSGFTAAGTAQDSHLVPLLHNPAANIVIPYYEAQKKEEKSCDFSSVVAGGGLEPPASGL